MTIEAQVDALAARVADEFNAVRLEGVARVEVVTGSEARPNVAFVIWLGGTTQPTNMADGDLWMSASSGGGPEPTEGLSLLATPWAATAHTDGGSSLQVGNSIYTTRPGGARILGAKLYIPSGASGAWLTDTFTFRAWTRDYQGSGFSNGLPSGSPLQTKVYSGTRTPGEWIEVYFDAPFEIIQLNSGVSAGDIAAVSWQSSSGSLYAYYSSTQFSSAFESQHGDDVFFAEGSVVNGFNNIPTSAPGVWYGVDFIYEAL